MGAGITTGIGEAATQAAANASAYGQSQTANAISNIVNPTNAILAYKLLGDDKNS